MIFQIDKNTAIVNPIKQTSFTKENIWERRDIQEWIIKNPDILGEELLIVSSEFDKFKNSDDRLDLLANQFYNDITLYWIIACANPNKVNMGSIYLPVGSQIRIPTNTVEIVDNYRLLNK